MLAFHLQKGEMKTMVLRGVGMTTETLKDARGWKQQQQKNLH